MSAIELLTAKTKELARKRGLSFAEAYARVLRSHTGVLIVADRHLRQQRVLNREGYVAQWITPKEHMSIAIAIDDRRTVCPHDFHGGDHDFASGRGGWCKPVALVRAFGGRQQPSLSVRGERTRRWIAAGNGGKPVCEGNGHEPAKKIRRQTVHRIPPDDKRWQRSLSRTYNCLSKDLVPENPGQRAAES